MLLLSSFSLLLLLLLHDASTFSHRLSCSLSAFSEVFGMYYLCDNHTSVRHTTQSDRPIQPILSQIVFQRGHWNLKFVSRLRTKAQKNTLRWMWTLLLLMWLWWCGYKGLSAAAVWGHISLEIILTAPLKGTELNMFCICSDWCFDELFWKFNVFNLYCCSLEIMVRDTNWNLA